MRKDSFWLALLLLALLGAMAAKSWLIEPPALRMNNSPGQFDAGRAAQRLAFVLGDQRAHPADTPADDVVRERIVSLLQQMGLQPQVRDQIACNELYKARGVVCARVRNIVANIGPASGKRLLLNAHYDSTPVGPGAGDDGAGVATLLEVASILKDRQLKRPATFLFNEGEELGLVGARAFLADPLSRDVDSLVNLEARGVRGPVNMFETSKPNGPAIAAFARAIDRPVANSLSIDVYQLLPNYTDVNTFAGRGWTMLNLAMIGNETRYHSAGDNLAALDRRSLQHMGDQTLALAEELSAVVPQARGERIFMDLAGIRLVTLPHSFGLVLLGLLTVAVAGIAWKRSSLRRGFGAVAGTLILSGAASWAAIALIGMIRAGMWWRAEPLWTHLAAYASAIAVAVALLATIGRGVPTDRLRPAFWLLFLMLGVAIALVAPGGIIFFLFPPVLALAGMFARRWWPGAERAGAIAAIAVLFLTWGELLALVEELLNQGPMWLFAPLGSLILLPALIEAKPLIDRIRFIWAFAAIPAAALWAVAAVAPAYSEDRQQQFTIEHVTEADRHRAVWSVLDDRVLPPSEGPWTFAKLPYSERKRWIARAPIESNPAPPQLTLIGTAQKNYGRRVTVRLQTNGAQSVTLISPPDSQISGAGQRNSFRGIPGESLSGGPFTIRCFGRSCDGLILDIVIGNPKPVEFILLGWRPGLPPSAKPLLAARPRFARAQYSADATIAFTQIRL